MRRLISERMAGEAKRRPPPWGGGAEAAEFRAAPERTAVAMLVGNLEIRRAVRVPTQV
jgi:hypothetical protein